MLTNEIQLKPVWEKRYKKTQLFVFVIFFTLLLYYSYKILFPSEYYTYSFRNPNDKSNTIINVSLKNNSIIFDAIAREKFSVIKINAITEKESAPMSSNSIKINKSYLAFFYPQGEDITNPNDFEINFLASEGQSVYIIGDKKKYPIDNPTTFLSHGFKWENIKNTDNIDLNALEKENLFNINDPHPDGTIFKIRGEEKYFLIKNKRKHGLKGDALKKPDLKKEAIIVEKNTELEEKCNLSKNFLSSKKYSCKVKPEDISKISGDDYRFNIPNISKDNKLKTINVEFKRDLSLENFKLSLKEIKDKIFLRYNIKLSSENES